MMRGPKSTLTKFLLVAASAACLLFPAISHAQDDPPPQAGRLSIVNGAVSIQSAGSDDWGQAYLNYPVGPGDRIFTDSDGRAEIQVGRTYVRIGPNSDVSFVDFTQNAVTFGIAQGAMHVHTNGLWDGQALYVQTPSGSSTVQAATDFRVDVIPQDQAAVFTNYEGDVYVSGANDFGSDTGPGQALELVGTNPVYPQWLQPADGDDLDQWSQRRDAQIARAASFRYVSAEMPGVEDMDAYGEWTPGTEYGDMWVPNVPAGWAPYHNGHWMNHDPWGWVWVEDEPWGYAPFHFGRWVNYRGRWGWIPGPRADHPVWSPALVVFAGGISIGVGGGGGVSAWFPLGPGEAYRPWYHCSPRYVDRVNITNIQESRSVHVQNTYVNVVNVTNVTNITYVNRTAGMTAMRRDDFASGRGAAQAAVRVDQQQMAHAQVLARPEVAPAPRATFNRPPMRPVPVQSARPVLINAKGLSVAAQPRATPQAPPMRNIQPPRPLPGRTVVAPPPNVRMTPTARQAMQAQPPVRPTQPQGPNRQVGAPPVPQPLPAMRPGDRNMPAQATPQPVERPGDRNMPPARATPQPPVRPGDRPAPPTQAQPPAQSTPQPGERPGDRNFPPARATPQPAVRPGDRPVPPPQTPAEPPSRQVPNNQPATPPRPPERTYPTPQQPPPNRPAPDNRPAPPPPRPNVQPPPPNQVRPEAPNRYTPPPQQPHPNVEPAPRTPPPPRPSVEPQQRPAPQRQAPPPQQDRNKKPDKDEHKPQ
ncbi:MAG TPA: DUF6600 domain-containing protein [Terracidiphilus sp.]|jgi:hypothetical protein